MLHLATADILQRTFEMVLIRDTCMSISAMVMVPEFMVITGKFMVRMGMDQICTDTVALTDMATQCLTGMAITELITVLPLS